MISPFLIPILAAMAGDVPVDFDREVRPILAGKCFACHGPDEAAREGGFRLDVRDEAITPAELSDKPAIVPGKPEESELIRRIAPDRKKGAMPPEKSNKTLSDVERQTLARWIAGGAKYTTHWSFAAPRRPELPSVKDTSWSRNPIDRFLLAKMESEGMKPSPEADRPTLIRRLTLDLTGLPPTLREIDAFLADTSPNAYETVVDRLLKSPRFGERMAVDWLDASRFADTHGFHIDSGRDMTRWRAWVINAFNANKPFDQFTVEQVAGDLLPDATLEQKIASGFNRNHMITFEGGAIPEEFLATYIIDRVNTTGTVWMGLTVGCTQCHDHKFDPISQKEYYGLYAFFHNVPESGLDGSKGNASPVIKTPSAEDSAALDRLSSEIVLAEAELTRPNADSDASQVRWEADLKSKGVEWTTLNPAEMKSSGGANLVRQEDGSILATGTNSATDVYTLINSPDLESISGVRLEILPDDGLVNRGPGRSVNGNVVLTDVKVEVVPKEGRSRAVSIRDAHADFSQDDFPIAKAIDRNRTSGWAISPEFGKAHEAVFAFGEPIKKADGARLSIRLAFQSPFASHQPGRFRVSATNAAEPMGVNAIPKEVREFLAIEPSARTDAQKAAIQSYYRSHVAPEFTPIRDRLAELRKQKTTIETNLPTAMVMAEMARPRDTFVMVRGQYDKKGEKVEAGVPAFLPPLPAGAPANRLGLARWLVDPSHPLTSRVAVNRYWQAIFGAGIVRTSDDFGTQGELPSHPELLDWLAVEFRETGWDVKRLIKAMVMTSAYRQTSATSAEMIAKDPENRYLARGSRHRLQAEFLRDQALFASGLLKEKIGGPSVSPYQPAGLWEELMSRSDGANWSAQTYKQSHGDDLYRRTMYTFWKRTSPPPSLVTFDAPDRETCTVKRARTNTPLQALVMLNDPTYVEASRKLAERVMNEGGSKPEERIGFAFRLLTSRSPRPEEMAVLREVFEEELASFRKDPQKAMKLLGVGESARDETLDAAELAAWSAVSGVILNLDEVVTRG